MHLEIPFTHRQLANFKKKQQDIILSDNILNKLLKMFPGITFENEKRSIFRSKMQIRIICI